jgi:hypothetical protein
MPEKGNLRRWPLMATVAETVQEQQFNGVDPDLLMASSRTIIPLDLPSGKLPYCVHQRPSKDGTVQGVRCGLAMGKKWMCENCGNACVPYRGR